MHNSFARQPLPERFCNFERLLAAMGARGGGSDQAEGTAQPK